MTRPLDGILVRADSDVCARPPGQCTAGLGERPVRYNVG